MDHDRELKLLYALDFGQRDETVFRLVGTFLGAVIIYVYTGWWYSWLWTGLFTLAQLLYWLAHRRWAGRATAKVIAWFHLAVLISTILFIWMPVKMIMQNDTPLSVSGAAVLGCMYVFMIRQLDHSLRLVIAQFFILALGSGIGVAALLLQMDMPIAMIGLIFSWFAFNAYFFQVVMIVRNDRLQANLAAERSAQSSKMEALGQMAGGVAHDFNNILTAAMGNLELAQVVPTEAERNECLDKAHLSLDRAAMVIRDLLQFARPSSSRIELQSSADLLAKVNSISTHILPNSIAVVTEEVHNDQWVRVDEDQFMTAMMNLMINASHATGTSGRIAVSASSMIIDRIRKDIAEQSISPGKYVRFSVTDDGPGVPPEMVELIVKPFFTTKLEAGGTGLGLPMVQAFANRMGGGLLLSSRPGETQFGIVLPQKDGPVRDGTRTTRELALTDSRRLEFDASSLRSSD